jgi:hypothetical protein
VDVASGGLNFENFLSFVGGQVFYCNPVVFFLIARAIWHRDLFVKPHQKRILLLVGLPLIILATAVSLFKELLPHWTGPAFAPLILLTASYYSRKQWSSQAKRNVPLAFVIANGLILFVAIAGVVVINFFPGTLGKKQTDKRGDGDFTLDMYGWQKFSKSFDSIYYSTHSRVDAGKTIILGDEWFPAAHIDFYIAKPLHIRTAVLGPIEYIHQYKWLNKQRGPVTGSTDIYVISPSNSQVHKESFPFLKEMVPSKTDSIIQYRNGEEARRFYIYYYKTDRYNFDPADF